LAAVESFSPGSRRSVIRLRQAAAVSILFFISQQSLGEQ